MCRGARTECSTSSCQYTEARDLPPPPPPPPHPKHIQVGSGTDEAGPMVHRALGPSPVGKSPREL